MKVAFTDVVGHKPQKNYLKTVIENGRFSHAYCFSGPASVGKGLIARLFAANLLNVEVDNLHHDINFSLCAPPIDQKTGEKKRSIPVESIRALRERLRLSSFGAGAKVAIITDADRMTTAAQNALLKTLEEPSARTVIILVAESAEALLETILSRTVHLRFSRISKEEICSFMQKRGLPQNRSHQLAGMAYGRPGEAVRLLDHSYCEAVEENRHAIELFFSSPLASQFSFIESFVKESKDRMKILRGLHEWKLVVHEKFLMSKGAEQVRFAQVLQKIIESSDTIQRNGSVQIASEHVII